MAVKKQATELHIDALKRGRLTLRIIGVTPFYFNAMSSKAKRDLLIGSKRKTAADKQKIKHDPESEFRDSVYRISDGPTHLGFPSPGIKCAMATAALETPAVTKTSVNRLIFLPQLKIPIWGKPYLKMDVVRQAGMNATPDIRTRAFLPRWCAEVDIAFVTPALSSHSIVSLLQNAGLVCGIGDFRQEKGKGAFGTFRVIGPDQEDEEWDEIVAEGRETQMEAMDNPECFDEETQDLLDLLIEERARREA